MLKTSLGKWVPYGWREGGRGGERERFIFSREITASDIVVPFLQRRSSYLISQFIPGLLIL
jgi:hypothetical protein